MTKFNNDELSRLMAGEIVRKNNGKNPGESGFAEHDFWLVDGEIWYNQCSGQEGKYLAEDQYYCSLDDIRKLED